MDRPSCEAKEERDIRDVVDVEESETGHRFVQDSVQFSEV